VQIPPVSYTRTPTGLLAWQSWGSGEHVVLDCGVGTAFSLDDIPDQPRWLAYMQRLASFARVLVFDLPATGLSDESPDIEWTYEFAARSALAVLDAAGVERAVLMGAGLHSPIALHAASAAPERVSGLVLINGSARAAVADDYPQGWPQEIIEGVLQLTVPDRAADEDQVSDVLLLAPSHAADPVFCSWWTRAARRAASPHVAQAANAVAFTADCRDLLPGITQRTLVLQRREQLPVGPVQGKYLADTIPGAQYVELPGADYVPFCGDTSALLDEIQEFVTGDRHGGQVERVFAVCLFTDIVGSTELATRLGDQRWRALQQQYDDVVARELNRFAGRLVKGTGDGSLATFGSPGSALRCALAIRDAMPHLDLLVRTGLHAGEIELRGGDVAGINVHIAARVAALAGAGEVLVSSTVMDLVAGSDFGFEDRGSHELKGVTGQRQVWAVTSG
jgi:class 3 adenylate cyclase/pimeloyl-ACP methyl ester carboxylesterase